MKHKKILTGLFVLGIAVAAAVLFLTFQKRELTTGDFPDAGLEMTNIQSRADPEQTPPAAALTADATTDQKEAEEEPAEDFEILPAQVPDSGPASEAPVIPHDLYVPSGNRGKFKAYNRDASGYLWDYYDETKKDWMPVSGNTDLIQSEETDELNRKVSVVMVPGEAENDGLLLRCRIQSVDEEENHEYGPSDNTDADGYQAAFHILDKEIASISVPENYTVEAGSCLSSPEIPVLITYTDETEETVTGLGDLFFCVPEHIESDTKKEKDGTTVETITAQTRESEYCSIEIGSNAQLLKYRGTVPAIDFRAVITGTDTQEPEISDIHLSDYEISNSDGEGPVMITATIAAADNYSPITKLVYALMEKGQEPKPEDFRESNRFEITVSRNGYWVAYAKDEAGNVGTAEKEIITVDQKAPQIKSVSLENTEDEWLRSNRILVEVEDRTEPVYFFSLEGSDSAASGWIKTGEYEVKKNGTWNIRVKDAAGNESASSIEVTNVDGEAPLILSVVPKSQKEQEREENVNPEISEAAGGSGTLADRVNVTVKGTGSPSESSKPVTIQSAAGTAGNAGTGSINGGFSSVNSSDSYGNGYSSLTGSSLKTASVKGEKGEKGDRGLNGVNGTSSYIHIKYADDTSGTNMSSVPAEQSRYIGIYTGASSSPPSSVSSYQWSLYKGADSRLHIRYSEFPDGRNMTEQPLENSRYMGVCASTDPTPPADPGYYMWIQIRPDSEHLHVMYAEDASGTNMSAIPTEQSHYMGICTDSSETPPAEAQRYTWSLYRESTEELEKQIDELRRKIEEIIP